MTSTTTTENTSSMFQVQLAIYDLSNGIAKALSSQFLGPHHSIEIVPHTSILAFGKEYYFGASGVEQTDPHHFRSTRQLFPIQIQDLGHTAVSQEEFEGWCRKHVENGLYASHSYDLFLRNCNNFSHHAATEGLRLKQAVPDWILDVPRRVLASPMGSLIRPMLEQMQIAPSGDIDNDNNSSRSTHRQWIAPNDTKAVIATGGGVSSSSNRSSTATKDATLSINPWENLPNVSSKTSNDYPKSFQNENSTVNSRNESASVSANDGDIEIRSELKPIMKDAPSLLDSYNRPLLSQDNKMIKQCTNKLKTCPFITVNSTRGSSSCTSLNASQRERFLEYLNNIPQVLAGDEGADPAGKMVTKLQENKAVVDVRELLVFLNKLLNHGDVSDIDKTFALMLVRLMVLEKDIIDSDAEFVEILKVMNELITNKPKYGASIRAMAWCVLGNAVGTDHAALLDNHFLETFVDSAMLDISSERDNSVDVRRGASAFLYNLVIMLRRNDSSVPVSDLNVKLLCEIMEAMPYEEDEVVATRILLTVGKIVKHGNDINTAAAVLMKELGYRNALIALSNRDKQFQGDEFYRLASEIVQCL